MEYRLGSLGTGGTWIQKRKHTGFVRPVHSLDPVNGNGYWKSQVVGIKIEMNENVITLLRGLRRAGFVVLGPFDFLYRVINHKRELPPLGLRQQVGDLSDFEGSGGEYIVYLKLLCGLKPGDKLLDIGCGCGLITLDTTGAGSLARYLGKDGLYIGMDTNKGLIKWCSKNIKALNTWFFPIEENTIPFKDEAFNVILFKSVFTHLLQDKTENYLREIKRLLIPGGKCLTTFFLLNLEQKISIGLGLSKLNFRYEKGNVAYIREARPELAVAYKEEFILETVEQVGLVVDSIRYGTWSGRIDGLSFQDIIILKRKEDA